MGHDVSSNGGEVRWPTRSLMAVVFTVWLVYVHAVFASGDILPTRTFTSGADDSSGLEPLTAEAAEDMDRFAEPPVEADSADSGYKVACHFTSWSFYRVGAGNFQPEDIDPSLCTHIHYSVGDIDEDTLLITPDNPSLDIRNDFYQRVAQVVEEYPEVKVLLTLGGYINSAGDKFSRLVGNATAREIFVGNAITFLKENSFHGLDMDWEYPKCWQQICSAGPASDKENYGILLRELKTAFKKESPPLLLAVTVPFSSDIAEAGFDAVAINESVDYVCIRSYDFYNFRDPLTGHGNSMYYRRGDIAFHNNVVGTMRYWTRTGIQKSKLLMGIRTFGAAIELEDANQTSIGAPVKGVGQLTKFGPGPTGWVSFFEVCLRVKTENWTVARDSKAGPYAFKGVQWVSFDDVRAVEQKAKYVIAHGFGGVHFWDLSSDDFPAVCCNVKYPLLITLNNVLRDRGVPPSKVVCW